MRVLRTLTFWHLWAVCCVNATKDDRKGTMSTVLNLTGRWHSLEAQARAQNSSQLFLKTSFSFIQYKVHICVHTRSIILSTSWSLPRLFLFASNATYAASTTAHVINRRRKTRDSQLGDRKNPLLSAPLLLQYPAKPGWLLHPTMRCQILYDLCDLISPNLSLNLRQWNKFVWSKIQNIRGQNESFPECWLSVMIHSYSEKWSIYNRPILGFYFRLLSQIEAYFRLQPSLETLEP